MSSRLLHIIALLLCFVSTPPAWADQVLPPKSSVQALKSVAVIYFYDGTDASREHAAMIKDMVKEASNNLSLTIHDYPLANEDKLEEQIDKISDDNLGLIIIIEPHQMEALNKIPSLYPDINFTVIGTKEPLYFANVRSMIFKDTEGAYLMGVLAALRSKNEAVGIIASEDNETSRNLAYAFLQGAKHANPDIFVVQQLGNKISPGTSSVPIPKTLQIEETKADVIFVLSDDLVDAAVRMATNQKRYLITFNHDLTTAYPGIVLTTLLKHYDLAMYHTLRNYSRGQWRAGSQSMGIDNSFLDYALNNNNKGNIPKETIEQLEMNKDFITQSIVQINALENK